MANEGVVKWVGLRTRRGRILFQVALATVLFSIFRMIHVFTGLVNVLVTAGWALTPIILVTALVQMVFTGLVVVVVMPWILQQGRWREWLPGYLQVDPKLLLTGLLSFLVFCGTAAILSLSMGIFEGNLATITAAPDIRPDPDIIGWGYFILALVPGIWEELAFRGLVQSKFQRVTSPKVTVTLSALFFGAFHLVLLLTQRPGQVFPKVIMAFLFGLGWGFMALRTGSVVPGMIAHYLVDAVGQVFLSVKSGDPGLMTMFFLLLVLLYPFFNIIMTKILYREGAR